MRLLQLLLAISLDGLPVSSQRITAPELYGCYKNLGSLKQMDDSPNQSAGRCQQICVQDVIKAGQTAFSVQAMTNGTLCLCGNNFPNSEYKVDKSECSYGCPGFQDDNCGSRVTGRVAVYASGVDLAKNIDEDPLPSSSSSQSQSSSQKTSQPSAVAQSSDSASPNSAPNAISSDVPNQSEPSTSAPSNSESSGVSKAGVAAGVVVGVLAIIAVGTGAWLFLRKRRRQQIEDEYRKSAAARGYAQKPSSDSRLDPRMVQKRDSVGSIADNQDYSRRILKVTNPDG